MSSRCKPKIPRAFISYSWDSDAHRSWVRDLAARLRSDGIDVMLDQWNLDPGNGLAEFMERAVRLNDYVIIICTPRYKKRSDSRIGGVGYEGDIITAEVFTKRNQRKFIPILRRGTWQSAAPTWLVGKSYLDFHKPKCSEANYQELLRTLYHRRPQPPPLGSAPPVIFAINGYDYKYRLKAIQVLIHDDGPELRLFHGSEFNKYSVDLPNHVISSIADSYNTSWKNYLLIENGMREVLQGLYSTERTRDLQIELGKVFRPGPADNVTLRFGINPIKTLPVSRFFCWCFLYIQEHDLEIDLWTEAGNECEYDEKNLAKLGVDFRAVARGASRIGESFGLRGHQQFSGPWMLSGNDSERGFPYLLMEMG